jgi:hypothetical protein
MGEERIDTIKLAKNFIACMNQLFNRSISTLNQNCGFI